MRGNRAQIDKGDSKTNCQPTHLGLTSNLGVKRNSTLLWKSQITVTNTWPMTATDFQKKHA